MTLFLLLQHQHPYLSATVNNGTLSYDHDRDGTHTMIGGCEVKFRNVDHETYIAIRYENDVLTGMLETGSSRLKALTYEEKLELTYMEHFK